MEKASKRGKIPQHDWPSIISRYDAGETLASIARTYDCSPPAISYIVSRTRARAAAAEAAAGKPEPQAAVEPQLVKTATAPITTHDIAVSESMHSRDTSEHVRSPDTEMLQPTATEPAAGSPKSGGNGWLDQRAATAPSGREGSVNHSANPGDMISQERYQPNASTPTAAPTRPPAAVGGDHTGEPRRTLHLSLSHGNGGVAPAAAGSAVPGHGDQHWAGPVQTAEIRPVPRPAPQTPSPAPLPRHPAAQATPFAPSASSLSAMRGAGVVSEPALKSRDGAFIDHALRERISEDITAFLAAFDAALDHDSTETRTGLREATDRLLRAGARTRIELERLEARVPLSSREPAARAQPAFRSR